MKKYSKPVIEISKFDIEKIMLESGGTGSFEDIGQGGWGSTPAHQTSEDWSN